MVNRSHLILPGFNDLRIFQDGWYDLEKSPEGILFRSSFPQATMQLPWPRQNIVLSLFVSARPEHAGKPLQVKIETFDKSSHFLFSLYTNGWTIRSGALRLDETGRICINCENPWSPNQLYHNGDVRLLGIMLSGIRLHEASKENE